MSLHYFKTIGLFLTVVVATSYGLIFKEYNVQNPPFNLKGDNTNSAVQIQAAIDSARNTPTNGGAVIYIPAGNYVLEKPIYIGYGDNRDNLKCHYIKIRGDGMNETRLWATGSQSGIVIAGTDTNSYFGNSWGNEIRDLQVLKFNTAGGNAIDLPGANKTTLENVQISTTFSTGFFKCGIRVKQDYVTITNCRINALPGTIERGISLEQMQTGNSAVEGTRINFPVISGCQIGIFVNARSITTITDATMSNCDSTGIKVLTNNNFTNFGLTIRNCQMEGCGATVDTLPPYYAKIKFQHNAIWFVNSGADPFGNPWVAKGVVIEGNYFNLEKMYNVNLSKLYSPYDIANATQIAQCTFNRNVYRDFDANHISEGLTVGAIPIPTTNSTPIPSPMLNVGGNVTLSGALRIGSGAAITQYLAGIRSWNPPLIANNAGTTISLGVIGAAVGDPVTVGLTSITSEKICIYGVVEAANSVKVTIFNQSGSSKDIGSGTLRVGVWKH